MNNSELVKVRCPGHDPRELKDIEDNECGILGGVSGLTKSRRLTSGLDLVYSTRFPFCIQSETIRKQQVSVETKTPTKGKILG